MAIAQDGPISERPQAIFLKDYRPSAFLIEEVFLSVELFEDRALVAARLLIRRNPARADRESNLILQGRELLLRSLRLDGVALSPDRYRLSAESLEIIDMPDQGLLETEAEIFPHLNTALEGLYRSSGNFCSQCEAEGFRKITWFLDRPDVLARYTVRIIADRQSCPVLLSNGNLLKSGELADNRHFALWQDPFPKPSYLFALVAGRLLQQADHFITQSGREVALEIYVEAHNIDKCEHAMASLKKAMAWDEETFGLEYDLERYMIVAVDDFNMGAMENKGLNVFNSKYVLAEPQSATDADYEGIEAVIAHEYFHNWTGNRVTCRDWFQLSLKEGLTVFRDQQFSADQLSPAVKRIEDVRLLRNVQFPEDNGPMAHPVRPASYIAINNFYTVTVYEKGAELIRMLHTLLGRELFRQGLALYLSRHDGQAATTDDFVAALSSVSGRDLEQFKRWYTQAGTPRLAVSESYDPDAQVFTLNLAQSCPPSAEQPKKEHFHIPIALALLGPAGEELLLLCPGREQEAARGLFELKAGADAIRFEGLGQKPVLSILRDFSAPVILEQKTDLEALAFLLAHDRDPFNRWEAGQKLALNLLLDLIGEQQAGRPLVLAQSFIDVFAQLLENGGSDPAFLSLLLTLPSEEYLAEQFTPVPVDAIHLARRFMRRALAESLEDLWRKTYDENKLPGPYRYEAGLAGRRSLKNLALTYLMATESEAASALALDQFEASTNMTDQFAALSVLVHSARPERRTVIEAFYRQWAKDSLVLDKWFSVQATAPLADTLVAVEELMGHPAFQLKNPNKVRALVGAFAGGNPMCFHAPSGSGYRFLTDQILALDPINPQIAARLTARLSRWRHYDQNRQALMSGQLERIVSSPVLSADLYEMASRSFV